MKKAVVSIIVLLLVLLLPVSVAAYSGGGGFFYLFSNIGLEKNIAQNTKFFGGTDYEFKCSNSNEATLTTINNSIEEVGPCLRDAYVRQFSASYENFIDRGYVDIYTFTGDHVRRLVNIDADKLIRVNSYGQNRAMRKTFDPEFMFLTIYLEKNKEYTWFKQMGNGWVEFDPNYTLEDQNNMIYGVVLDELGYIALVEK